MWNGSVVYCKLWSESMFSIPVGEEGGCGFGGCYFESVCGEPGMKSVEIRL